MKETLESQDKRLHELDDNCLKQSSPLDFFPPNRLSHTITGNRFIYTLH